MMLKHLLPLSFLGFILCTPLSSLQADEVILNSGETISGRITSEAADFIKIEVSISESIKETKLISRSDISKIVKEAPDNVEFAKLQKLIPTGSMLPASSYETMLTVGPEAFLKAFPDSQHVEAVKEMQATLEEELDKVERGYIKIKGTWISPQEREEFAALTNSKIRLLNMERAANAGNYLGFIGAMREFENLEKNFYGSPAFAEAVELALQVIPSLGAQLNKMSRDVDYRNAEFERNKAALDEVGKAQIDAARAKEDATFATAVAADKKAGIKWTRLNNRSKPAIEAYIKLASTELNRIKQYDTEALKQQGAKLEEVDELISEGKFPVARIKLTEAAAITSSPSSKSKKGTSYIAALDTKLSEKEASAAEMQKAKEEAAQSESLAANLKETPATEEESEEMEESPDAAEEESTEDLFNALSETTKKPEEKETEKEKSKPAEEEREERPRPPVADEGGFSFGLIVPILTVVLVVAIVLLKVLGIGGKKEGGEE